MYSNLSNFAEGVDTAFVVILSIIIFFLVALTATLIIFLIKYRESKNPVPTDIEGNIWLEIVWTLIPLALVIGMFYYGWTAFIPMISKAPENAIEVKTTAQMWSWRFEYENGKKTDTLIIPVGKPIELLVSSPDVLHSLYIPAFRIKQDVIPGRVINMWFQANVVGEYDLFCAEYCGLQHAFMLTEVKVVSQEDFDKWYIDTTAVLKLAATPGALGLQLLREKGCIACHSLDGSKLVGPSYKGIFGHETVVITKGEERTILVNEEYIKKSIYNPDEDLVKGFNKGLMRSYQNELTDEDVEQIIIYIKTLSDKDH